jgi:hypothetical protein
MRIKGRRKIHLNDKMDFVMREEKGHDMIRG